MKKIIYKVLKYIYRDYLVIHEQDIKAIIRYTYNEGYADGRAATEVEADNNGKTSRYFNVDVLPDVSYTTVTLHSRN